LSIYVTGYLFLLLVLITVLLESCWLFWH